MEAIPLETVLRLMTKEQLVERELKTDKTFWQVFEELNQAKMEILRLKGQLAK